jgi:hypothetical protein
MIEKYQVVRDFAERFMRSRAGRSFLLPRQPGSATESLENSFNKEIR